ncbi:MAG TPA: shikimate dehydrogenase [Intrasporangium sp.]|uniref:shikimate dehydrogenase n=1 Tax=Intrasporangium sp. TaxID=1925024 RepID=UPI002D7A0AC9|nr:shikimate dehydrogenase [Intrasporangium sp.]HET7398645.1 shikimate dehydrogenase [Intrasporangium sp.]
MSTTEEAFLVGLVGDGVLPSLSPALHEREADAVGLRYLYRPLDLPTMGRRPDEVGAILREGAALGYNAFNITYPCKQLVLDALDEVDEDAARLDAVNTVLVRDGRLVGRNTDWTGFAAGLASGLPEADLAHVVLVGSGGAGSAVAYALLAAGASRLDVVDLDAGRAEARAASLAALFPAATVGAGGIDLLPALLAAATGLVHATPVGMHHHPGLPVDRALLRPGLWVADIVYRPVRTQLVAAAEDLGCPVLDGGHMAVGQAVDSFRLITGVEPDRDRMRAHFLQLVAAGR